MEEVSTCILFFLYFFPFLHVTCLFSILRRPLWREIRKELLFPISLLLPYCNLLLVSKYPKTRRKSLAALLTFILKLSFKKQQQN